MPQRNNSVRRALDALELVSNRRKGISFSDIARELGVPKSSLSSLVHTLRDGGYLHHNADTGLYSLGLTAFEVGTRYLDHNYHREYIARSLEEIAKIINETVHFGILDKREVVYLDKFESSQPIRMSSSVGRRMPAHATAIGKSLLSGHTDNELRQLYANHPLERLQPNTITDVERLIEQMHDVRERGYAWENCESSADVYCVATPLKNANGGVVAAMSIAFPLFRAGEERREMSINLLVEYAKKLTIAM